MENETQNTTEKENIANALNDGLNQKIITEFKNKGFKLKTYKKGILFNKQFGTQKHNTEQLFYKDIKHLIKFYKYDLELKC